MKNKLFIAILILGFTINLRAQNCDPIFAKTVTSSVADGIHKSYKDAREAMADYYMNKQAEAPAFTAIELQKSVVGSIGNFLDMGPVHLLYNLSSHTKDMGRLQGEGGGLVGGNRQFIVPIAGYDRTTVTVKKTDGKAGADIAVCIQNEFGNTDNMKDKSIGKGDETTGDEVSLVFYNTADKFVLINIIKTDGFNDFAYTVEVDGEFNEEVIIRNHGQASNSQSADSENSPKKGTNLITPGSKPNVPDRVKQLKNENVVTGKASLNSSEKSQNTTEESKTYTKEEVDQHLQEKEQAQQEAAAVLEAEKATRQQKRDEIEQQATEETKNKAKDRRDQEKAAQEKADANKSQAQDKAADQAKDRKNERRNQQDKEDNRSQEAKDRAKEKVQERKQDRPEQQTKEEQIKERAKDRKQKRDDN